LQQRARLRSARLPRRQQLHQLLQQNLPEALLRCHLYSQVKVNADRTCWDFSCYVSVIEGVSTLHQLLLQHLSKALLRRHLCSQVHADNLFSVEGVLKILHVMCLC